MSDIQGTIERLDQLLRSIERYQEELPARCALAQAIGDALFGRWV